MTRDELPFDLQALFAPFEKETAIALAVSGGPDSMALVYLLKEWINRHSSPPAIHVLTVNHNLRAQAGTEAEFVKQESEKSGFFHVTLSVDLEGKQTAIQETAREKRYQEMSSYCQQSNIGKLLLAHHADDQIETFYMRLARGSAVDGLSVMQKQNEFHGVTLCRPFLATKKATLLNWLKRNNLPYCQDASNKDEKFERVRLRNWVASEGYQGPDPEKILLSISRQQTAKEALDYYTNQFLTANVEKHDYGFCQFNGEEWAILPVEIKIRLLKRLIENVRGSFSQISTSQQFSRQKAENLLASGANDPYSINGRTLGGCYFFVQKDKIFVTREAGRILESGLVSIASGAHYNWDHRFDIKNKGEAAEMTIVPLQQVWSDDNVQNAVTHLPFKLPHNCFKALPALMINRKLASVPSLEKFINLPQQDQFSARLANKPD